MFYREVKIPNTTRGTIHTFLGYNHNSRIAQGEVYDMCNLCSDEYPSLAPRKPRNCILSLENDDWREVEAGFTAKLEGQVSSLYAIWTSARIETQAKERIAVSYERADVLSDAKLTVRCYREELLLEEYQPEVAESVNEIFEMPEGATHYQIEIIGTPADVSGYTEANLAESLRKLSVMYYNWNIRGMLLKDGKIGYLVGSKLYYDGDMVEFDPYLPPTDDYRTNQQLLSFGAYVLIFPLGLYFNTHTKEYGSLGAKYEAGAKETRITFTMCDAQGEDIDVTETKPNAPSNGDYWLDTSEETPALYKWSESLEMWVGISSTYIRIGIELSEPTKKAFPQMFEVGDAIYMNSGIDGIDKGSIIVKKGNNYDEEGNVIAGHIVVKGLLREYMEKEVDPENVMYFERRIPKLDYVCVSNNRVWGCYNGVIEGEDIVNEIYACKLGDPKNWYCYEGAATDSYTLSLGDDGEFTGAFTYQGYPTFFKENVIYKIYGAYPAAYQLYTYNCRGVQKGSSRSLAVVNEYLMYKSVQDVCVFDGNTPTGVSQCFGNEKYIEASAGAALGKYYLSMKDAEGACVLFVFDLEKAIWHKEDGLYLEEFAYNNNGELYGRNRVSMYGFANAKSLFGQARRNPEEVVEWSCRTGEMGTENPEKNYVNAIQIRMIAERNAAVDVYIEYPGQNRKKLKTLRGTGKMEVHRIPVVKTRCIGFRIALEGRGACRMDALIVELEKGSDR